MCQRSAPILAVLLCLAAFPQFASAQTLSKIYDLGGRDSVASIEGISNGGLAVTGTIHTSTVDTAFLFITDAQFDTLWYKKIPHARGLHLIETSGGDYVLYYDDYLNPGPVIAKYNAVGQQVWAAKYSNIGIVMTPGRIQETADKGFAIAVGIFDGFSPTQVFLKADSVGNFAIIKTAGWTTLGPFDAGANGTFWNIDWWNGWNDIHIQQYNALGDTIKLLWHPWPVQTRFMAMRPTSDGGFVAVGWQNNGSAGKIFKIDSTGSIQWDQTLNPAGGSVFRVEDVVVLPTGGYALTGECDISGARDLFLMTVDTLGNQTSFFTTGGPLNQGGYALNFDAAGNFVVAGYREDASGVKDVWLLKFPSQSNSNLLQGTLSYDFNGNCLPDPGDGPAAGRILRIVPINYFTTTDTAGNYAVWLPTGTYSVDALPSLAWQAGCPATAPTVTFLAPGDTISGVDIALTPQFQAPKMRVTMGSGFVRPCSSATFSAAYLNEGTLPAINAQLDLDFSANLVPVSASQPWILPQSGTLYSFDLDTVQPNQSGMIVLQVAVSCSATAGNFECVDAHIFPDTLCGLDSACVDPYCRVVTAAFDPNQKTAFPVGAGPQHYLPQNQPIEYRIDFQNTGNDTAFKVVVADTLSHALDLSTLQIGAASHAFTWTLSQNRELSFTFDNILLPDSTVNFAASQGFVQFEISPLASLVHDDLVENQAAIYFDFNPPIRTDTVRHRICEPPVATGFTSADSGLFVQLTGAGMFAGQWIWDFGDGTTGTGPAPSHSYAQPGSYVVCLVVQNACGADTVCDTVSVCALPVTTGITYQPNGSTFTFQHNYQFATGLAWDFGDGNTSATPNPVHTYAQAGTYTVTLVASGFCGSDTTTTLVTLLKTSMAAGSSVSVFPNPGSGTITIEDLSGQLRRYVVLTPDGKELLRGSCAGQRESIDLKGVAPGIYFLRLETAGSAWTQKIIVL